MISDRSFRIGNQAGVALYCVTKAEIHEIKNIGKSVRFLIFLKYKGKNKKMSFFHSQFFILFKLRPLEKLGASFIRVDRSLVLHRNQTMSSTLNNMLVKKDNTDWTRKY